MGNPQIFLLFFVISSIAGSILAAGFIPSVVWLASTTDLTAGAAPESVGSTFYLLLLPSALLATFFAARLIPSMFSAAMGDSYGLKDAWRMTRGYSLKLIAILAVVTIVPFALTSAYGAMFDYDSRNPPLVLMLASTLVSVAMVLWANTYLAVIYEGVSKRYAAGVQSGPAAVAD